MFKCLFVRWLYRCKSNFIQNVYRLRRPICLMLVALTILNCSSLLIVNVSAAIEMPGSSDTRLGDDGINQQRIFDVMCRTTRFDTYDKMIAGDENQQLVASAYGDAVKYNKWLKKANEFIAKDSSGHFILSPADPEDKNCEAMYNTAITQFNRKMLRIDVEKLTGTVFESGDFKPTSALAVEFCDALKLVANNFFQISSLVIFFSSLAFTGLDLLYICQPCFDFILARGELGGSKSGGTIGNGGSGFNIFNRNIVSDEAIAARGGGQGGLTNAKGKQDRGIPVLIYIMSKLVNLIFTLVYLVLIPTQLWTKLCSFLSTLIASFLYSVIS